MRISLENPHAKKNIEFIRLVKQYRAIYDRNHKYYGNQRYVLFLWQKIATKVMKPEHICKRTWTNLRVNYTRSVKHQTEYVYKSALNFLFPHLKRTIQKQKLRTLFPEPQLEILAEFYDSVKDDEQKFDELDYGSRAVLLQKIRGIIKQTYQEEIRKRQVN